MVDFWMICYYLFFFFKIKLLGYNFRIVKIVIIVKKIK